MDKYLYVRNGKYNYDYEGITTEKELDKIFVLKANTKAELREAFAEIIKGQICMMNGRIQKDSTVVKKDDKCFDISIKKGKDGLRSIQRIMIYDANTGLDIGSIGNMAESKKSKEFLDSIFASRK